MKRKGFVLAGVLMFLLVTNVAIGNENLIISNHNIISGKVKVERHPDNNYYYVAFGSYDKYGYYDQLLPYLTDGAPENLQKDSNSIGQHMTINPDFNLNEGYDIEKLLKLGETYKFAVQTGFILFEPKDPNKKYWYVKILVPVGNAAKVFKDANNRNLHTSVAFYYYYIDDEAMIIEYPQLKPAI